jgi:hypothetical protein
VVKAVKKKSLQADLDSMTRAGLQSFIRTTISAVIFKGSWITIHSRPESKPSFPLL